MFIFLHDADAGGKLDVGKGVAAVSQALGLPAQASALVRSFLNGKTRSERI